VVTQAQVDIWLNDPVTKALQEALDRGLERLAQDLNALSLDPHDSDYTHAMSFQYKGHKNAFNDMLNLNEFITSWGMINDDN